jgi:hypothetical protein
MNISEGTMPTCILNGTRMTIVIALLLGMAAIETWAFIYSSPKPLRRAVVLFNRATLLLGVALSTGLAIFSYLNLAATPNEWSWPAAAAFRGLVTFCAVFFVVGPIRYFVFRRFTSE